MVFIKQLICHVKTPLVSLQMEQTWFRPAFMRRRILTQIRDVLSSGSLSKYHGIHNEAHFTHLLPSHVRRTPTFPCTCPAIDIYYYMSMLPAAGNLRFYSSALPL